VLSGKALVLNLRLLPSVYIKGCALSAHFQLDSERGSSSNWTSSSNTSSWRNSQQQHQHQPGSLVIANIANNE